MTQVSQLKLILVALVIVTVLMYIVVETMKIIFKFQKKVRQHSVLIISMGASVINYVPLKIYCIKPYCDTTSLS